MCIREKARNPGEAANQNILGLALTGFSSNLPGTTFLCMKGGQLNLTQTPPDVPSIRTPAAGLMRE